MSAVEIVEYDGAFNVMFIVLALVACLIGRACMQPDRIQSFGP
jgi:hypothetical protein